MKKLLGISAFSFLALLSGFSQTEVVDTLYFQDGRTVAVEVTLVDPDLVHYHYPGETVPYQASKTGIDRIVFRTGRVERFSKSGPTDANYSPVSSVVDWEKVAVVSLPEAVEGLHRVETVAATRAAGTVFSTGAGLYESVIKMLKMQAAAQGANVVLLREDRSRTVEAQATGTAFNSRPAHPEALLPGAYMPKSGYMLNKNQDHFTGFTTFRRQELSLTPEDFTEANGAYFLTRPGLIRNNIRTHRLLSVDGDEIVLGAVSADGVKVYNLVLVRE